VLRSYSRWGMSMGELTKDSEQVVIDRGEGGNTTLHEDDSSSSGSSVMMGPSSSKKEPWEMARESAELLMSETDELADLCHG